MRGGVCAQYYGKGMRIDFTLVSAKLVHRIKASEILGHGKNRHGFCGSDHCPIWLDLERAAAGAAEAAGAEEQADGEAADDDSEGIYRRDTP